MGGTKRYDNNDDKGWRSKNGLRIYCWVSNLQHPLIKINTSFQVLAEHQVPSGEVFHSMDNFSSGKVDEVITDKGVTISSEQLKTLATEISAGLKTLFLNPKHRLRQIIMNPQVQLIR